MFDVILIKTNRKFIDNFNYSYQLSWEILKSTLKGSRFEFSIWCHWFYSFLSIATHADTHIHTLTDTHILIHNPHRHPHPHSHPHPVRRNPFHVTMVATKLRWLLYKTVVVVPYYKHCTMYMNFKINMMEAKLIIFCHNFCNRMKLNEMIKWTIFIEENQCELKFVVVWKFNPLLCKPHL